MTLYDKPLLASYLRKALLFVLLATCTHFSYADTKPQTDQVWLAMTSSAGLWDGKIYFKKDPKSPTNLRLNNKLTPDHATIISYLTFEKNNDKKYAMELMTYSNQNKQLYESYFENGHAANHTYDINSENFKDAKHWSVSYSRTAKQDNNIAKIKLNWQREGNRIIRKEFICEEKSDVCQLNRETKLILKS